MRGPDTAAALEVIGLVVRRDGRVVLDVPALTVPRGEVLAIIGPNGAGKSTLLRALALLEPEAVGEVRLAGEPVPRRQALAARRRMAAVFQEPLLADASVRDNVALGLRFRGRPAAEIGPRVDLWLARFGIAALAGRRARTLSGGEAQRAALARAMVLGPEVLLLDEPFAALDQPTREALIADLADVLRRERVTTVLVTHDRGEALALADRVAVLMDGRLLQVAETATVFRAPVSEAVARFVGVETILDGRVVRAEGGVATVAVGGCAIQAAAPAEPGEAVRLCLRPEDVTVSLGSAGQSSARNRLPGRVARLVPAGPHVRVGIDCGVELVALVTRRSVDEMGLAPGLSVVAEFKATAAHLLRPPAS